MAAPGRSHSFCVRFSCSVAYGPSSISYGGFETKFLSVAPTGPEYERSRSVAVSSGTYCSEIPFPIQVSDALCTQFAVALAPFQVDMSRLRRLQHEFFSSTDKLYDLCFLHLLLHPPSFLVNLPSDHLLYHPHPSCLLHDVVVVAAAFVVGCSVYVETAETMTVAFEDQVNCLDAIDPNRLDCRHYSRAGDAEGHPVAAHDSAS